MAIGSKRLEKLITFCDQKAKVVCDAKCEKAWGNNARPTIPPRAELDAGVGNPDDYCFLADDELGDAPDDPGTYEGGHGKPRIPPEQRTPDMINKWCVRECERMRMSFPGEYDLPLDPPHLSHRLYNIAPHRRS